MFESATLECRGVTEEKEPQARILKRRRYINAINYSNFKNEPLQINFKHKIFSRNLTLSALPSPCIKDCLELKWENNCAEENMEQFDCLNILIPDGETILSIIPVDYDLTPEGMTVSLPTDAVILNHRKKERFPGKDISATLMQNGCFYEGRLINFNPDTFLIILDSTENPELRWINRDDEFNVLLKSGSDTIFTDSCLLSSSRDNSGSTLHTFQVLKSEIRKFKKKLYRGERFPLQYPVQISFNHPLSKERCQIPVIEISASGFGLMEEEARSVLIPGLIINDMELNLPGGRSLKCKTQVISRRKSIDCGTEEYKCGMVLIDMGPDDHAMLLNFVHQENDSRTSVCTQIDSSALWKFFFETGFLYPEKYKHLSSGKEKIKELYDRLYTKNPGIARHFIFQERNRIKGHMSMLRSYDDSWLLHHHAATSIENHNAGLHVLNQVGSFINNSYHIGSLHMRYIMCYYREENRFPRRVFGDIANNADDRRQLSLDSWAYFHYDRDKMVESEIELGWALEETTKGDIKNLECFYQNFSGGLMLKAMNIINGTCLNDNLLKEYDKSGFDRDIRLYSINYTGECRALIMVDQSETGLNMSNLTNSLKVFIINPSGLTHKILYSFIHKISNNFDYENRIPVLMFPENMAEELDIPKEKQYTLWVLNTEASDDYFKHLKNLLKEIHH